MHLGSFKGRAEKRQQKPGNNRRKFNHLPTNHPIPLIPKVSRKCKHACNKCHQTFVADSREAFCRSCGSNALTVTYIS